MDGVVKGYKVFNPDWTCRGKQYVCPGKFEEYDVELSVCNKGMHFCGRLADCFNYYNFSPDNKAAEVAAIITAAIVTAAIITAAIITAAIITVAIITVAIITAAIGISATFPTAVLIQAYLKYICSIKFRIGLIRTGLKAVQGIF